MASHRSSFKGCDTDSSSDTWEDGPYLDAGQELRSGSGSDTEKMPKPGASDSDAEVGGASPESDGEWDTPVFERKKTKRGRNASRRRRRDWRSAGGSDKIEMDEIEDESGEVPGLECPSDEERGRRRSRSPSREREPHKMVWKIVTPEEFEELKKNPEYETCLCHLTTNQRDEFVHPDSKLPGFLVALRPLEEWKKTDAIWAVQALKHIATGLIVFHSGHRNFAVSHFTKPLRISAAMKYGIRFLVIPTNVARVCFKPFPSANGWGYGFAVYHWRWNKHAQRPSIRIDKVPLHVFATGGTEGKFDIADVGVESSSGLGDDGDSSSGAQDFASLAAQREQARKVSKRARDATYYETRGKETEKKYRATDAGKDALKRAKENEVARFGNYDEFEARATSGRPPVIPPEAIKYGWDQIKGRVMHGGQTGVGAFTSRVITFHGFDIGPQTFSALFKDADKFLCSRCKHRFRDWYALRTHFQNRNICDKK